MRHLRRQRRRLRQERFGRELASDVLAVRQAEDSTPTDGEARDHRDGYTDLNETDEPEPKKKKNPGMAPSTHRPKVN